MSFSGLTDDSLVQIIEYVSQYRQAESETLHKQRSTRASVVPRVKGVPLSYVTCLDDQVPILDSLQALAVVNKRLLRLCLPRLWQSLSFPTRYSIPIEHWTTDLLPKYGSHLRSITISLSPNVYRSSRRKRSRAISPQNVKLLLSLCTQLTELTINLPSSNTISGNPEPGQTSLTEFLVSLAPSLTGLRELRIKPEGYDSLPEVYLAKMVQHMPLLETLYCENLEPCYKSSDDLRTHLPRLQHLSSLHIKNCCCLDETWVQPSWPGTITNLVIDGCENLMPHDANLVLQDMAPNLRSLVLWLECEDPPQVLDEEELKTWEIPFDFQNLTELKISSLGQVDVVGWFKGCKSLEKIEYFVFGRRQWADLVRYITKRTWPHLKLLDIRKSYSSGHTHRKLLEEACHAHGVELLMKPPADQPSTDEEDEDED